LVKSPSAKVPSNAIGHTHLTAEEWLKSCGVEIVGGKVILYKSTKKDFTTQKGISFQPGTTHEATDWDANFKDECGCGIHYCPTVLQAKTFRDEGTYIACEVSVSDMAGLPAFAQYPDKIRAKGGKALYQVDGECKRLDDKKPFRDFQGRFAKRESKNEMLSMVSQVVTLVSYTLWR